MTWKNIHMIPVHFPNPPISYCITYQIIEEGSRPIHEGAHAIDMLELFLMRRSLSNEIDDYTGGHKTETQ